MKEQHEKESSRSVNTILKRLRVEIAGHSRFRFDLSNFFLCDGMPKVVCFVITSSYFQGLT